MKRRQEIYRYFVLGVHGAECGLEIFDPPSSTPVVVLTQLPWNWKEHVGKAVEWLAAEVAVKYLPERADLRAPFHCIQHTYPWSGGDDVFELVTFDSPWPREEKRTGIPRFGQASWKMLTRSELEAMIGEQYVDAFRVLKRLPPPDSVTIEAVRLLRAHFGPLTKVYGPLTGAHSKPYLPVLDPPEFTGSLYLTELDGWVFMHGDKNGFEALTDEQVASRWKVSELVHHLLVSVHWLSELLLTHLELIGEEAEVAYAVVRYITNRGQFVRETIEARSRHEHLWEEARQFGTTPWELSVKRLFEGHRTEVHGQEA
ncbi:MAG: hypothetical protein ACYDD2_16625 [Candidatus Acidiferrales bacterium]